MFFPSLNGNWVDFLIIVFLLAYIWEGWGTSFVSQLLEFIAFTISFLAALKFYPLVSQFLIANFSFSMGLANAIGFIAIASFTSQLFSALGSYGERKIPPKWQKHLVSRYLSLLPLFLNAIVILSFILTIVLALPIPGQIKAAVTRSKIAEPILSKTQRIEKELANIFGSALEDSLNFITVGPVVNEERVKLNFTQQDLLVDETAENKMLQLVNEARRSEGLKELKPDQKLRDLARTHAKDMFEQGYFSHYNPAGESPFDRMEKAGINYRAAGENLALAPSVTIAHQGLMDSSGHRTNILSADFGKVGIGVIDGGIYGKMFVQEFTN